ncbi:MAG: hypothetical protein Q4A01_04240 [Coriobacteriales bacterium]|nr:hypothetical protein [Coriobacteriales bacterium]
MNATTNAIPTIVPDVHRFMETGIVPTGDYLVDCVEVAAESLRGIGCLDVEPEPSMGTVVTCEDGDETVLVGVMPVVPDAYDEFTLDELDRLIDEPIIAMLATMSIQHALGTTPLPMNLRADVLSVCIDPGRGRARVHHVKAVWHS